LVQGETALLKTAVLLFIVTAMRINLLADVVELRNGDRLSGDLKGLSQGKLVLVTPYAGEVKIDWKEVARFSTSAAYDVEFISGRTSYGVISMTGSGLLEISSSRHELATPLDVAAIRVRSEPTSKPASLAKWHGAGDFGYTLTRGNSHSTQLAFQLQPERRTDKDRIRVDLQSLYSILNSSPSANGQSLETRYDRFLSPRLFAFGVGKAARDQRERVNLRSSQGGGFGLRLEPGPDTQISVFGGSTFLKEDFKGTPDQISAEALAGSELQTKFSPLQIATKLQVLPNLTTLGRYRTEWDANVRIPLTGGLKFGIRLFIRSDSQPQPGVKKLDSGLLSTIGFDF
jgi:putative salt-induced outer membrane protein